MFERFTPSARAAVDRARQEAIALGHGELGPEHLLVGVLVEDPDITAVLGRHGVTAAGVRAETEHRQPRQDRQPTHVPFSPHAKRVFEMALLEAKRLRSPSIGCDHIVLAVTRDRDSVAAQILQDVFHVDHDVLWRELGAPFGRETRPFLRTPVQLPVDAIRTYRRRHLVSDIQALLDENDRLRRLLRERGVDPDAGEQPA